MAQPILKRRLNPFLLISTVAALSLLAGVAVISQDRIAAVQEEKNNWQEKFNERNNTIQRLSLENENKSRQITALEQNISETTQELNTARSELQNKTERIENLEAQLDQQSQQSSFDQSARETIRELNSSIQIICEWGDPESGVEGQTAASECQNYGYDMRD
jgi:septal ring factor EnvC (AmiA/AmiB activator)